MTISTSFFTAKEAAEILSISRTSVFNLMNRPQDPLPSYKFGGIRIDAAELEAWIKRQKRPATTKQAA